MSDVFISYASADRALVKQLSAALEAHGWSVWWDREIQGGQEFDRVIERELAAARCVIVVWSPAAVDSQWVRAEAEDARQRGILIPVLARQARIPLVFRAIQTVPLMRWRGDPHDDALGVVVRSVERLLGAGAAPATSRLRRWLTRARAVIQGRWQWLAAATLAAVGSYVALVLPPWGMALVPAVTFPMGSQFEETRKALKDLSSKPRDPTVVELEWPQHDVHVDAFLMDRFEVTASELRDFWARRGKAPEVTPGADTHPATGVTWELARSYCASRGKSLPTEAQWEAAARGASLRPFPWGRDPPQGRHANFCDRRCDFPWRADSADDGFAQLAPVGSFPAGQTAEGLYDLAGNVSEWVRDRFDRNFYMTPEARQPNPMNDQSGDSGERILRGGSWRSDLYELRGTYRHHAPPEQARNNVGFRCAASADAAAVLKVKLHDLGLLW